MDAFVRAKSSLLTIPKLGTGSVSVYFIEMLLRTNLFNLKFNQKFILFQLITLHCNISLVFDSMHYYSNFHLPLFAPSFPPFSTLPFVWNVVVRYIVQLWYGFKHIKLHSIIGRKLNSIATIQTDDELISLMLLCMNVLRYSKWNKHYNIR